MVRVLFLDLDGTLLTDQKELTPYTKKVLAACKARDVKLFVATGRPPLLEKMASWGEETMGLFDGGVYCNGGCTMFDGVKTYDFMDEAAVRSIMAAAEPFEEVNIALQLEDEVHAFRMSIDKRLEAGWGTSFDAALTLAEADKSKVSKMLVFYGGLIGSGRTLEPALVSQLKAACAGQAQMYVTDGELCVQAMGLSVNKYRAVERVREAFGLDAEEIAVFGDDVNDREILTAYPNSYAMANAAAEIQAVARHVTERDNNHDGVACAIMRLIGLEAV